MRDSRLCSSAGCCPFWTVERWSSALCRPHATGCQKLLEMQGDVANVLSQCLTTTTIKSKQQTSSNNSSTASTQSPHTATHRHRRTEQTHMVCCQNITSNNSSTASHQGYFFFPRRGISHSASRHAKICYVGRFQKASCRRTGCAGCAALLFAGRRAL